MSVSIIIIIMLMKVIWPVVMLLASLVVIVQSTETTTVINGQTVVDLTHPLNSQTLHWIDARDFELKITVNGTVRRGESNIWVQADEIYMATHTGTHLDAPCHFARGKWSVADIPIVNFVHRPVALIDIVDQSMATRDYELSVRDIHDWEKQNGPIVDGSVILVRTGWARFWPKKLEYFGTETKDEALLHFPGVHPEAAQWIVDNRQIMGIGIDSPSIDHGQSKQYRSHQIFAQKNIYHLENIAQNIHKLPAVGAHLTLLPLKIDGASGTSVRIIAEIGVDNTMASISNSQQCFAPNLLLLLSFVTLRYIIS
ncbi:isatin hydrolase-like [Oppia nitens]|uniref:isatin hydrolase-like n=1 Tax=Oppia nitens TaxID=1686743 RepID=UPI0023D9E810|nr:isatin hydrolase-like [Oppia nitens]